MSAISLDEIISRVTDLPPLPEAVTRLMQLSRDPDSPLGEIVETVRLEPSLTLKVLKLCNSAYYGLPRAVSSIQQALVYIGTDTLVNFILAGCASAYYRQAHRGYGLAPGELWRHSVGCAFGASRLCGPEGSPDNVDAFSGGLLHDVGKIVLNTYVEAEFGQIIKIVRGENIPFEEAERRVLGFSHTDAGRMVAEAWNLPEQLVQVIAYHQQPLEAESFERLVARVHVANILCVSLGIGMGSEGLSYTFHPGAVDIVGVSLSDLYPVSAIMLKDFNNAEEMVGLAA